MSSTHTALATAYAVCGQGVHRASVKKPPMPAWEVEDAHAMIKVCQHNMMACKLLKEAQNSGKMQWTGTWENKQHCHFPSLILKLDTSKALKP